MTLQANFSLRGRNPDVLTCISNLSSDEVFTPPEIANQMLDLIAKAWFEKNSGANIWEDKNVKFLDPCTKSGVFLREITTRLTSGLASQIPDLQLRVNHILKNQIYGIGITRLTSLLARRSLYCSKLANSQHSVARCFDNESGNIWFERLEHTWVDSKCIYCSAPRALFDRGEAVENYAYALLHRNVAKDIKDEMFGEQMQFDVIIGNPPYQMKGGAGGSSDSSIYHLFVEQAIALQPKFLSMVVPARWMAGGRGLDNFRANMLGSNKLSHIVDYQDSGEAFPGVQIKGGICYFLWDSTHDGEAEITRVADGEHFKQSPRNLNEFDVLVRDERALGILKKVLSFEEP